MIVRSRGEGGARAIAVTLVSPLSLFALLRTTYTSSFSSDGVGYALCTCRQHPFMIKPQHMTLPMVELPMKSLPPGQSHGCRVISSLETPREQVD